MDDNTIQSNQPGEQTGAPTTSTTTSAADPIAEPQASDTSQGQPLDDQQIKDLSNEEIVAAFAEGLLQEKNLGEMDDDTHQEMLNDLIERLNDFINRAILESLPKEKLDELDQMIANDSASPEAVSSLIVESGIDAGAASVDAMTKFREIYLNDNTEDNQTKAQDSGSSAEEA